MNKFVLCLCCLFFLGGLCAQNHSDQWCISDCQAAGDEKSNTSKLYNYIQANNPTSKIALTTRSNQFVETEAVDIESTYYFPIRICIIDNNLMDIEEMKIKARKAIVELNNSYVQAGMQFGIDTVEILESQIYLEDLYADGYKLYNQFSSQHDRSDLISLFIFDHGKEFCEISDTRISCGRIGGFSYIYSQLTNNVVMSNFDLSDPKIVAHEFGHFFGLYHPFEEAQFGKDNFDKDQCHLLGDRICDTPPDPGAVFEVYVNYSTCEMIGLKSDSGEYYMPLLNNYMSYYKPCYLKEYSFTNGQVNVLRAAAQSDIRTKFQRPLDIETQEENPPKEKRKCIFRRNNKG